MRSRSSGVIKEGPLHRDPHYRMKWRANPEESLRNRSAGSVRHLQSDPTHFKQTPRCWRTLALAHSVPGIILPGPLALRAIPPQEQKGYEEHHPMPVLRRAWTVHADERA
jgi:hypothetical protein